MKASIVEILFDQVWNQKNLKKIPSIFTEDFTLESGGELYKGRDLFTDAVKTWLEAFPDLHYTIVEEISNKNRAIIRWRAKGTHQGPFLGIAPTGRKIDFTGISILKISNGKFSEGSVVSDTYALISSLKVFSEKQYSENDFSVDFSGPAQKIYEWVMNARPIPSCKQKMTNAIREVFSTVPLYNIPEMKVAKELTELISKEEFYIAGMAGRIRTLIFRPIKAKNPLPIILYFHGGGWSIEGPEEAEFVTRKLSLTAHALVISIDYRLAPENPFPCGLDDAFSVYQWMRKYGKEVLHADSTHVFVGGDSSGGNIALALALRARDEDQMPTGVLALCPGTDFVMEKYSSTLKLGPKGLIYDYPFYSFVRSIYAPYDKWTHPYVSPMYGNLENFCPCCIIAAGQDLLYDENRLFFEKLLQAHINHSEWHAFPDMPHAFYYFLGFTPDEERCYEALAKFVQKLVRAK